MKIQPSRYFRFVVLLAGILFSEAGMSRGQTADQGSVSSPEDAAKRAAAAALLKKRFLETRDVGVRLDELSSPTPASTPSKSPGINSSATGSKAHRIADTHATESPAKATPPPSDAKVETPHHTATPSKANIAAEHSTEPHAKATPSAETKAGGSHSSAASQNSIAETHTSESHTGAKAAGESKTTAAHPSPVAASTSSGKLADTAHHSDASTPQPSPAPHHENVASAKKTPESRNSEVHTVAPSPKPAVVAANHVDTTASAKQLLEMRIVDTHPMDLPRPSNRPDVVTGRYPWKTDIITTVFWIGEPVGGHNFTPNCSSSWDANWTRSYGGFDNPNPEARRNYLPVSFVPRQNPFYVALPYNDVTRGTTKPESRVVIPWFREAFRKEGQSVCRDRWVAVRSRTGRVAYAQWSDCGPFRTDHWQYVFGMDRPKPNLNGGAGLDVSPAMRDYLGLQSTDVTDWKFVDLKDVPSGPWLLYGENNPFAQRRTRPIEVAADRGR
jgi:hypothetical protein